MRQNLTNRVVFLVVVLLGLRFGGIRAQVTNQLDSRAGFGMPREEVLPEPELLLQNSRAIRNKIWAVTVSNLDERFNMQRCENGGPYTITNQLYWLSQNQPIQDCPKFRDSRNL